MNAAYGKAQLPWAAMEAQICERFHKWPEELDEIDVGRLLRGVALADINSTARKMSSGATLTAAENDLMGRLLQLELDESGN